MMIHAPRALARQRLTLCVLLAASTALVSPALAQARQSTEAAATDQTTVDSVVVTGSRIKRSSADAPTPTTIIDESTIKASGVTEIADLVNQIPSLAQTQTNQTSNLSGEPGLNALDLRGLGTKRTLVLVNGRRHVPAMPGSSAVDVSTLPAGLIKRVEVITGGASAMYGADAVAGVANFILKTDYDGLEASARYGGSTRGDMKSYDYDILVGHNFAEGRGNLTAYAYYGTQPDAVTGNDRPWTSGGYPVYTRPNTTSQYTVRDGVRNIYAHKEAVVLLGGSLYTFTAGGALRTPTLGPSGILDASRYDLTDSSQVGALTTDGGEFQGRYNDYLLQVPTERFTTHGALNYQVTDNLHATLELDYAHNRSQQVSAAWTSYGGDTVPADSPFITAEMIAANGGPFTDALPFTRKYDELGKQVTKYGRDTFQAIAGLNGDVPVFGKPWTWSAYYSFGRTSEEVTTYNATAEGRYYDALDSTTDGNGNAVCRSTLTNPNNGCVPLNPFKDLTAAEIKYLQYSTSPAKSTLDQHVVSAYMTGDLFKLPAGAVQAVLGAEYRRESNDIGATPEYDPTSAKYDETLGITQTSLKGQYNVAEAFGELRVPILAHLPLAEQLSVEAAVRLSDYSTAGRTTAYKFGGEWQPIRDLRFRATYGQAVRAPNISELFTTNSIGGAWVTDPCQTYNVQYRTTKTQYTAANCAALAVGDTSTYWQWRDVITKGNADLDVETAKTLTLGTVLQPRFLKNFSFSADYYDITINGAIGSFGAQTILEHCVDSPTLNNMFCGFITRDSSNNIVSITTQNLNLSEFHTRGVDFESTYRTDLSALPIQRLKGGRLSFNLAYTLLLKRDFILDPSAPNDKESTVGVFGSPKWKGVLRTTYDQGPVSFTWTLRHYSGMRPTTLTTAETYSPYKTPDVFYNDVSAAYDVRENVTLFGGLNNVLDRAPPRLPGAEAGGANFEYTYQAGVYDVVGRTFYVGLRFKH